MGKPRSINTEGLLDEYRRVKCEYASILEEKEYLLYHKSLAIKEDYIMKIGRLEYELFYIECSIARMKRKNDLIRSSNKLEISLNMKQIDCQLREEYGVFIKELQDMASDIGLAQRVKKCNILTANETLELQQLYFSIVKHVHPDLSLNQTEEEKLIWTKTKEAFKELNIKNLRTLCKKVNKIKKNKIIFIEDDKYISQVKRKIKTLKSKTKAIKSEILDIKNQFPFNVAEMLENSYLVETRQEELRKMISEGKGKLNTLQNYLFMQTPGINDYKH